MPTARTSTALDKPDTIAGAIKLLLRDETKPFTRAELLANLQADGDYKKLLDEHGTEPLDNALRNWSFQKRLLKEGRGDEAQYTVSAEGRAWMMQ